MYNMCIVKREYLWYNEYNGKGVFFLKNLPENKKVIIMSIKYQKLFALMKEKGLTTYKIRQNNIISQSALTALKSGKNVTTETIDKLCKALQCQPGDILEYVDD